MSSSRRRMSVLAVIVAVVSVGTSVAAWADDGQDGHRPYLALGDSVVFGYITQAGFEYGNPDNFVGYPDYAANPRLPIPTEPT
jgi:hypothetical protein